MTLLGGAHFGYTLPVPGVERRCSFTPYGGRVPWGWRVKRKGPERGGWNVFGARAGRTRRVWAQGSVMGEHARAGIKETNTEFSSELTPTVPVKRLAT